MVKEIYTKKIEEVPKQEMRYGRGLSQRLITEAIGARKAEVKINRIYANSKDGPMHYHKSTEDIYIVLSGKLRVKTKDKEYYLGPDEFMFIPPGVLHGTSNIGDDDAVLLEICAPVRGDDFIEVE